MYSRNELVDFFLRKVDMKNDGAGRNIASPELKISRSNGKLLSFFRCQIWSLANMVI